MVSRVNLVKIWCLKYRSLIKAGKKLCEAERLLSQSQTLSTSCVFHSINQTLSTSCVFHSINHVFSIPSITKLWFALYTKSTTIRHVFWLCKYSQHSLQEAIYMLQISLMEQEWKTKCSDLVLLACILWHARMANHNDTQGLAKMFTKNQFWTIYLSLLIPWGPIQDLCTTLPWTWHK